MFYTHKAYVNAKGGPAVHKLTHDVKRAIGDSKAKSGHINVLSTMGTVGVILLENDPELAENYLGYLQKQFSNSPAANKVSRRSGSGQNPQHLMAALCGLQVTIPFADGRLLSSPFHEILGLDFEPKAGRREFVITITGEGAAPPQQGGMPPGYHG